MPMTPEQEREVAEFAQWANGDRRRGITLAGLYKLHESLANTLATHQQDIGSLKRWRKRLERTGVRDPQPSLGPDDSGSIDLAAFGTRVKLRGEVPVKLGALLIAAAALLAAGYCLHLATAPAHASSPPAQIGAVK